MKTPFIKSIFSTVFVYSFIIALSSCDLANNPSDDNKEDKLYVQFNNDSSSTYTITSIELQDMGVAGETPEPSGVWSENVLADGIEIAPKEQQYFNADIPNLHWCKYRLTVKDGHGALIPLHEQTGYIDQQLPLTHWGSDERTVNIVIVKNTFTGLIEVTSWSEFAGIE